MQKNFNLVFDKVILSQFKKAGKNKLIRNILSRIFDKIESLGSRAGNLIDSQLRIYEVKLKRPPMRLYFQYKVITNEIYIFEYEMKKSQQKQQNTIKKLINKILKKSKT